MQPMARLAYIIGDHVEAILPHPISRTDDQVIDGLNNLFTAVGRNLRVADDIHDRSALHSR